MTGSLAHSALLCSHANIISPPVSLLKKVCKSNLNVLNVPVVLWGREKESEALSAYKDTVSNPQNHGKHVCINKVHFHQDFEIAELGLVLKVDEPWCFPG